MARDQRVLIDEASRVARHESIKEQVNQEVQAEINNAVEKPDPESANAAAALGERLKRQAVKEVVETESEIGKGRIAARVSQVMDFVFWIAYSIIGLEIVLELIGARESNMFRQFVHAVSRPLLAPFSSLVPDPASGRFQFRISYVVALVVYGLLHLALNRLIRLWGSRVEA